MDSRKAASIALSIMSFACRAVAFALCALSVILCFNGLAAKLGIVELVVDLTRVLPDMIAGYGLIPSPFGGVFRLDFLLIALGLYGLDYALGLISRTLRSR